MSASRRPRAATTRLATTSHEVSAVTGACLAIQREAFEEVGGFDEMLAVAFNDVMLCMDLLARGRRNLYVGAPLMRTLGIEVPRPR